MQVVGHDPAFAAKVGIPQSVGREFSEAGMARDMMPAQRKMKVKKIADALKRGH